VLIQFDGFWQVRGFGSFYLLPGNCSSKRVTEDYSQFKREAIRLQRGNLDRIHDEHSQ
jgi:hypothetical protein